MGRLRNVPKVVRPVNGTAGMRTRTGWLQSQALHGLLPLRVALFTSRNVPLCGQTQRLWGIAHAGRGHVLSHTPVLFGIVAANHA